MVQMRLTLKLASHCQKGLIVQSTSVFWGFCLEGGYVSGCQRLGGSYSESLGPERLFWLVYWYTLERNKFLNTNAIGAISFLSYWLIGDWMIFSLFSSDAGLIVSVSQHLTGLLS